ncbi:MAG: hypothetical protein IK990_09655 [Ruminiclostridium sp.]|nr:hypothetical protein [Ruminiclostridium sp.]
MLAMLVTAEVVINIAARVWFPLEAYVLSPMIAIVCIVMMRWGPFAAVHAVGGGLALCIVSGAEAGQYAVYCIGNCFALAALLLFKKWDKKTIREKIPLTILFTVTAFCGAQIGRWLVGMCFGGDVTDIVRLVTTDSLSLIFAVITTLIARRIDGLFEDQIAYLLRTQAERNKEQLEDYGDTEYGDEP